MAAGIKLLLGCRALNKSDHIHHFYNRSMSLLTRPAGHPLMLLQLHISHLNYLIHNAQRGATLTTAAVGAGESQSFKLIIYSKDECHLCDGLKEKLNALIDRAAFMPSILSGVELEVRDILSNPEWEQKYSMTIPVLTVANLDGTNEREVPRPSPRFTADALEKHLTKHLST